MDSKLSPPSFKGSSELARYIHEEDRNGDRHAAPTAFMLSPEDLAKSGRAYLSVNSLEVEAPAAIATYCRDAFQDGIGDVAICTHKVTQYVTAARKFGVTVSSEKGEWVFGGQNGPSRMFTHLPTTPNARKGFPGSKSHCGVHFVRELSELKQKSLARHLAKSPRFHLHREPTKP